MSKMLISLTVFNVVYAIFATIALIWAIAGHSELKIIVAMALCAGVGYILSPLTIVECLREKREMRDRREKHRCTQSESSN